MILLLSASLTSCSIEIVSFENIVNANSKISATGNIIPIIIANGYTGDIDPSAGHTDPSVEDFFSPTDDLTILLLFS